MAQIQFTKTSRYRNINVTTGENSYSKLFAKYTHTIPSIKSGDINLCKDDRCKTKLILNRDIYQHEPLNYSIVYCNKYSLRFPLILILGFNSNKNVKRKYYKLFDLDSENGTKNLSKLTEYNGEVTILETLINENDRIDDLLTFRIDNQDISSNSGLYNNRKIQVTDESEGVPNFKILGFQKYKHTPQHPHSSKNSCIIYDNDILYTRDKSPIENIQNQRYDDICVYYSDKVREPLLIELSINKLKTNSNKFYYHTRGNSGSLFWLEINKGSRPFDVEFNEVDIHQELTSKSNSKLLKLLSSVSSHLQKTLFVMIDQKTEYSLINVSQAFQLSSVDSSKYRLLNKRPAINVVDKTNDISMCKGKYIYNVYEHDLTDIVSGIKNGEEKAEIKCLRSITQNNISIINLDNQHEMPYLTGSSEIEVAYFYNNEHNYSWVRHYSNNDITNKDFELTFKGQSVKVKADVSDFSHNKSMFLYFQIDNLDRFFLLVFPNKENDRIKYLTYDEFKKNYIGKTTIDMNKLQDTPGSINFKAFKYLVGYDLDSNLKTLLDQEKDKKCSIRIEIDKNVNEKYNFGSFEINVTKRTNELATHFNVVEHSFEAQTGLYDVVFHQNYDTKTLDISGEFKNGNISISIYFHSTNNKVPLIVGFSNGINKKHFTYAEFFYKLTNSVMLSDLKNINNHDLISTLTDQNQKLQTVVTFKIPETGDYGKGRSEISVKVLKGDQFDDFKFYTHIPSDPFKHIELETDQSFDFTGLKGADFTYQRLMYIMVYYHVNDTRNLCPLLVRLYTRDVTEKEKSEKSVGKKQYEIIYNNIYYELSEIDRDVDKKIYKICNLSGSISSKLYLLLNGKLKSPISRIFDIPSYSKYGLISFFQTDHSESQVVLNYMYGNDKLYVYFHQDDPYSLLLCYGKSAYKRSLIDEQNSVWIEVPGVTSCLCNQNQVNQQIISALDELVDSIALIKKRKRPEKKESSAQINLSIKNNSYGTLNSITASDKYDYANCDLFIYYKHSLPNHTFSISSLKFTNPQTKIVPFDVPLSGVESVRVYFNKNANDTPVLLEVIFGNGKRKYLKYSYQEKNRYSDSDTKDLIDESHFVDELISESDRLNGRLTCQIDKTDSIYGSVTFISQNKDGVMLYTHTSRPGNNKPYDVLYKQKLLIGRSRNKETTIEQVQNQNYKEIRVYCLDSNDKFPLLVSFKISNFNSYVLKRDNVGVYWLNEQFVFASFKITKHKLDEIYYFLAKSIIIELDQQTESHVVSTYDIRLIDNIVGSDGRIPKILDYIEGKTITDSTKIKVSDVTNSFGFIPVSSFKSYAHDISGLKGIPEFSDIGGLRFYIKSPGNSDPNEIQLYDNSGSRKNRMFLYYNPNETVTVGSGEYSKIKVFFHKNDPRPLLIYCQGKGYKRLRPENHNEWYNDTSISISGSHLLRTLKNIYSGMKKKIFFLKDGNINNNVNTSTDLIGVSFNKLNYFAKVQTNQFDSNYRISKDRLNSEITDDSILGTLFHNLYNNYFDSINVYKNKTGSALSDILVFEFTNETQKTYFQKVDKDGKYWVHKETISGNIDDSKLTHIKSESANNLIYQIDKTSSDHDSIITIQRISGDPENGFNKFIHSPKDGTARTSILFYKNEELVKKNNSKYQSISEMQNKKCLKIIVYFGEKNNQLGLDNQKNVPLLIEFTKDDKPLEPEYYLHKLHPTDRKYYWQKLVATDLKNILIDIGFATKKGEAGYDHLKQILEGAGVEKVSEDNDLSTKLTEIKPDRLKNLLNQKVGQPPGPSQKGLLALLLRKIEFELLPSIVILLDKKDTNSQYGDDYITQVIRKIQPKRDINLLQMDSKKIYVNHVTETNGKCVKLFDYKLISHNITLATKNLSRDGKHTVPMRFAVPSKTGVNYHLLTFYNNTTEPEKIEYNYYSTGQNIVYVFFYGNDPRPLLMAYNGTGYRATSKNNYDTHKWSKISKSITYPCETSGSNEDLLNELTNLSKYFNEVQLQRIITSTKEMDPNKDGETSEKITYSTDNFNGEKISIDLIYRNLSCYRFFKHKANGTGSDGSGYRLGNVKYNNTILNYSTHHPLLCVYLYYSLYDVSHQFPLMIHLEFKNHNEYYELNDKVNLKWQKIDYKIKSDDIEKTVYDIRSRLEISYNDLQKQSKLFDDKDCKEDDPDLALYVGAPVGGLAGAGALGGGGYLLYAKVIVMATTVAPS